MYGFTGVDELYTRIDYVKSGKKMKSLIQKSGFSVKEVQDYLHLSCPQPIYRWFQGKALPTVNHLYALSNLLNVHMEEFFVMQAQNLVLYDLERIAGKKEQKRIQQYHLLAKCAV